MEIRKAITDDIDSLAVLLNELENYNFSFHKPSPNEVCTGDEIKDFIRGYLKNPHATVFIAKEGNESIGYVHILHNKYGKYCVLEDLFVLEKYRGNGVGKKLLKLAEEWAQKRSPKLKAEVFKWNRIAREFYQRKGYKTNVLVYVKKF